MNISLLSRSQLKDIIRANNWTDKPDLTVSEGEMKSYLDQKIASGDLVFGDMPMSDETQLDAQGAMQAAVIGLVVESEENTLKGNGRLVVVKLLQPMYLKEGKKTIPKFDADGLPTVEAKMPVEQAKTLQKAGVIQING